MMLAVPGLAVPILGVRVLAVPVFMNSNSVNCVRECVPAPRAFQVDKTKLDEEHILDVGPDFQRLPDNQSAERARIGHSR